MYSSETTRQQFIQHNLSFIFEYYRMQRNIKMGYLQHIYQVSCVNYIIKNHKYTFHPSNRTYLIISPGKEQQQRNR